MRYENQRCPKKVNGKWLKKFDAKNTPLCIKIIETQKLY